MEASSDDSFNLWTLCWEINSCFLVKIDRTSQCLKCGKEVSISSPWRSDFVRSAVVSYCSHTREGFLCGSCDQETLYRITQATEKCFAEDCEEALTVQEDVVKQRLGQDTALLENYLEALRRYSITCSVCADVKPRPKRPITNDCSHEDSTCTECIAHIIDMSLDDGGWINLKCPSPQCKQKLTTEDIRFFASPEAYARYEKLWFRQSVNEMPDFRYCLANGCKWGQLHPQQSRFPKITCMKCGAESCFTCQIRWHRGMTCAEYKAGATPDKASEEYMRKYCKRCPRRGCGIYIEKNGLCPHLWCEGCKESFCWECKLLSGHLPTCRASPGTATKPGSNDKTYREGWDEDPGYEGTPNEYSGGWEHIQRRKK